MNKRAVGILSEKLDKISIVFVLLAIYAIAHVFVSDAFSQETGIRRQGPPPEAYEACEGKNAGDYAYKISAGLDGIYITGETTGALDGQKSYGKSDIFITKYDFDGNKKWTRVLGSNENDYGNSLFVRLDGIYITGGTKGNLGGIKNNGQADIFIAKYDFNGVKKFTKLYGTSKDDICNDIIVGFNFFYLTGETSGNLEGKTNNGGSDIFVMMFSDI